MLPEAGPLLNAVTAVALAAGLFAFQVAALNGLGWMWQRLDEDHRDKTAAVLKFSFGVSYEYNTVNFGKANISQQITYILTMVVAHHLMLFCLEIFSFKHIDLILKSTLFSSIFSLIIIHSLILLFNRNIR